MSTDRPRRPPLTREVSHGGVVLRHAADGTHDVLVIVPAGKSTLGLPKGGANDGETGAETAAREVREETGVTARVVEPLGDVRYWYRRRGRRVVKTVHFYLFDFVSGDTADHDHEVDDARWIPLLGAQTELSFPGEREMIERALQKVAPDR